MTPIRLPKSSLSVLVGLLTLAGFAQADDDYVIPPEKKQHWAWKPPTRPPLPAVKNQQWVRTPVDAFVLAKLEAEGLQPAPATTRERLIRRVTLDLIGLPPTPEEIDAFVNDQSPTASERVLDRLLASPHYGERWGRHWLDLARFAESNGYEFDEIRPDAWRYRDYVIRAFNADKPYDRFLQEQLAGDELYPDDANALIATGFNLLGPDMTDASDQKQRRQNTLNDMTDTAGLVFLGMTISCARCHDHKFEPIPQADYYRLQAFFTPAVFRNDLPIGTKSQRAVYDAALKEYTALIKPTQQAIRQIEEPYRKKLYDARFAKLSDEARAAHATPEGQRSAAQKELVEKTTRLLGVSAQEVAKALSEADKAKHKALQDDIKKFDAKKPAAMPVALGLRDAGKEAPKSFLLDRGELSSPTEEVLPGFPIILSPDHKPAPAKTAAVLSASTGRRSALAAWLTHKDNPLTARVLVNRVWQHHFGRGIVATPSDFGVHGRAPTHPELLDWLAVEFVADGWSVKRLHKRMLLSAIYQQSAKATPKTLANDPDNELFARMQRLRLEGEIVRDSLLAVSGRLNESMGGPGVFPPVPADVLRGFNGWKTSPDPREHVRRSVYIFARRNLRFPFLEAFDLPDSNLSCPKRERSTTAPQALALLNAPDIMEAAQALATRLTKEASSEEERITLAYRLTLGRRPSAMEMDLSREFLTQSPLRELCRALFNLNEFVYLD